MRKKRQEKQERRGNALIVIVAVIFFVSIFVMGGYIYLNRDRIRAKYVVLSPDLARIVDSIELTPQADDILRATRPALQQKEEFNESCNSHDQEVYVLGCYDEDEDRLFVYNVESEELPGVREVTTAHELLHAVYHRLYLWEKFELDRALREVYDALPSDSDLHSSLSSYDADEFYDELHSRVGTEIADIPDSLHRHFAKYFKNREKIIKYNDQYHNVFKKLKTESEQLKHSIEEKRQILEGRTKTYRTNIQTLNEAIADFNFRVVNNKFSSQSDFRRQRDNLTQKIRLLAIDYNQLKIDMESLNRDIEKYNQNIYRSNELVDKINSNSIPATTNTLNPQPSK